MRKVISFLIAGLALILAGCGGAGAAGSGAVKAVESYYNAIITQNSDQLNSVTCPEFHEQAQTELDSFQGVKSELQGFSCKESGKDGDMTLVKCNGKIVATYGSEKMDFPISDRLHKVKNNGGNYQVCGY